MLNLPTAPGNKRTIVYDWEVYPNWFCLVLTDGNRIAHYSPDNAARLASLPRLINKSVVLAGFNSESYDDLLMRALLENPAISPSRMYDLSKRIIEPADEEDRDANFRSRFSDRQWAYTIDVFQLMNGKGSLKETACRMGVSNVAEAPYAFDRPLPDYGKSSVLRYCQIDAENTVAKLRQLWPLVELREKMAAMFDLGDRVYCSSEQGLAQLTFLRLHRERTGEYTSAVRLACKDNPDNRKTKWLANEIVAPNIRYRTKPFQAMLQTVMICHLSAKTETLMAWEWRLGDNPGAPVDFKVSLADAEFQIGVGGLHSIDGPGVFRKSDDVSIIDLDVTSYYPSLMIERGLYPAQLGPEFIRDFKTIRDRRVAAKKAGDTVTADALKIVLNSTFGKLNDFYSPLRSIPDALRVTVNGQLYLLMLIEMLHENGATILSANTDGVTIAWSPACVELFLPSIIEDWQSATGFALEQQEYSTYARRDVNSYVAMTVGGKVKTKGAFHPDTGKGDGAVIKQAAIAHILQGVDVSTTIQNEYDKNKHKSFLFYQRCRNGGTLFCGSHEVGRLARWFVVPDGCGEIIKRRNPKGTFAKIPNGENARLAMTLTDDMPDPDLAWYAKKANELISAIHGEGVFEDE